MKTKSTHRLERDIEHYILKWEYDIFQRMRLTIILNMNSIEKILNSKNSTCILLQSMEPNAFVLYYGILYACHNYSLHIFECFLFVSPSNLTKKKTEYLFNREFQNNCNEQVF